MSQIFIQEKLLNALKLCHLCYGLAGTSYVVLNKLIVYLFFFLIYGIFAVTFNAKHPFEWLDNGCFMLAKHSMTSNKDMHSLILLQTSHTITR